MVLPGWISWLFLVALVGVDLSLPKATGWGNTWLRCLAYLGNYGLLVLILSLPFAFWAGIKGLGWLLKKTERFPRSEEVVGTAFVVAYLTYILFLILVLPKDGSFNVLEQTAVVLLLLLSVAPYGFWVEKNRDKLSKKEIFNLRRHGFRLFLFIVVIPVLLTGAAGIILPVL